MTYSVDTEMHAPICFMSCSQTAAFTCMQKVPCTCTYSTSKIAGLGMSPNFVAKDDINGSMQCNYCHESEHAKLSN